MEKGKMIINGVEVGGSFGTATSVPYSNTNSGLEATNVQGAIDELNSNLTNENAETFNFGVLNGVRGFFTDPSRADDCFIPFNPKGIGVAILSKIQIGVDCYNSDNIQPDYFSNEYFDIVDGVITCKKAVSVAGFSWNDSSVNNGWANTTIKKNGTIFTTVHDRKDTVTPSVGYTTLDVGDVVSLHAAYQHQGTYQATNSGFALIAY